jgi:hypothetical protein
VLVKQFACSPAEIESFQAARIILQSSFQIVCILMLMTNARRPAHRQKKNLRRAPREIFFISYSLLNPTKEKF